MAITTLTVIVVEDDTGMRAALTRLLEIAGCNVASFASAEDCLASGTAAGADCVVCDVHLPGDSGFELHQRLAQAGAAAPVIFITAHDSAVARDRALRLGAAAYLAKPFEGRALVDAVKQATSSR